MRHLCPSAALGFAIILLGCNVGDIDYGTKRCPCPKGYTCDELNDRCVQGSGADASCSDGSSVSYEILNVRPGLVVVDGSCSEAAWSKTPVLPTGYKDSDNSGSCRLLWEQGPTDFLYGCCQIGDFDLQSSARVKDSDPVWHDDSIESVLKANLTPVWDATSTKVMINLLGTVYDFVADDDVSYDAHVVQRTTLKGTLNDSTADMGYAIEWKQDAGFAVVAGQVGLCTFATDDRDGTRESNWYAFNQPGASFNDPKNWGVCRFSCTSVDHP